MPGGGGCVDCVVTNDEMSDVVFGSLGWRNVVFQNKRNERVCKKTLRSRMSNLHFYALKNQSFIGENE